MTVMETLRELEWRGQLPMSALGRERTLSVSLNLGYANLGFCRSFRPKPSAASVTASERCFCGQGGLLKPRTGALKQYFNVLGQRVAMVRPDNKKEG